MKEYHKIQTMWERDPNTKFRKLLEGKWALPEFEYLKDTEWMFTEKVDGTNVRVHWDGESVRFGGRTDNAQMPVFLMDKIQEIFTIEKLADVLGEQTVTLYGEGYGAKIQKGGGDYIPDGCSFICFDIRVGPWWLKRQDVEDMCSQIGVDIVPIVGVGTLLDGVELVRGGFESLLRRSTPEGIVMRPKVELTDRGGRRIISKLKVTDF